MCSTKNEWYQHLESPALLLDRGKLDRNIARLAQHLAAHGVPLRPHVKTAKSVDVARRMQPQPGPITVSTLREASAFLGHGWRDIIYAVGMLPIRVADVIALQKRGADLKMVVDDQRVAQGIGDAAAGFGAKLPLLIEIDADGERAGIPAGQYDEIIALGRVLEGHPGTQLVGVLTHAGGSYHCRGEHALRAMASQEREAAVGAAEALRAAGLPCPIVSIGSTPTALFGENFSGITEVRAGVHVFFDLVMANLGVCRRDDIALSVFSRVIGHRRAAGELIIDAGGLALSKDRGMPGQSDAGYGVICSVDGHILEDFVVRAVNQEHGIVAHRDGQPVNLERFPMGSALRVLPNHACMTAAAHDHYHVLADNVLLNEVWYRVNGWFDAHATSAA